MKNLFQIVSIIIILIALIVELTHTDFINPVVILLWGALVAKWLSDKFKD